MPRNSPQHQHAENIRIAETIKPGLDVLQESLLRKLKKAELDGSEEQQNKVIELVRQIQLMSHFESQLTLALLQGQTYLKEVDNG